MRNIPIIQLASFRRPIQARAKILRYLPSPQLDPSQGLVPRLACRSGQWAYHCAPESGVASHTPGLRVTPAAGFRSRRELNQRDLSIYRNLIFQRRIGVPLQLLYWCILFPHPPVQFALLLHLAVAEPDRKECLYPASNEMTWSKYWFVQWGQVFIYIRKRLINRSQGGQ